MLAISLFTDARLSLISNRIRPNIDEESLEECQTPFQKFRAEASSICLVLQELGMGSDALELALAFNLEEECGYSLSQTIKMTTTQAKRSPSSNEEAWLDMSSKLMPDQTLSETVNRLTAP